MPADPVLIGETHAWLHKAAHDLRAAGHNLTASPPLLDDALFHCQQAAEKALKGFLMWNDIPFRKTHSLEEIGEQCLDLDSTLHDFVDRAIPLTEYAWKFRYPGEPQEPSLAEVEDALLIAKQLYEAILVRLPSKCGQGVSGRPEENPESPPVPEKPPKNPHAVALSRLGAQKGGKARAEKLTPERRSEIARKAVQARWAKKSRP